LNQKPKWNEVKQYHILMLVFIDTGAHYILKRASVNGYSKRNGVPFRGLTNWFNQNEYSLWRF